VECRQITEADVAKAQPKNAALVSPMFASSDETKAKL